jgi:hypothetical protein
VAGLSVIEPQATDTSRKLLSDKMALLRLLALSLLFAVATPIRDITDACSSQVKGTAPDLYALFIHMFFLITLAFACSGFSACN